MENIQEIEEIEDINQNELISIILESIQSNLISTSIYFAEKLFVLQEKSPLSIFLFLKSLRLDYQWNRAQRLIFKNKKKIFSPNHLIYPQIIFLALEAFSATNSWDECLEILGGDNNEEENEEINLGKSIIFPENSEESILFEKNPKKIKTLERINKMKSLILLWKGKIFLQIENRTEKAKKFLEKSLETDFLNFEGFEILIDNELLSSEEGLKLLTKLKFSKKNQWIKHLYITRLRKTSSKDNIIIQKSHNTLLKKNLNFSNSSDLLFSRSELLLFRGNFESVLSLCNQILENDPFFPQFFLVYVPTLVILKKKTTLFEFAHTLDNATQSKSSNNSKEREKSTLSFILGCYYLLTNQLGISRQHFGNCISLVPHFVPGWLAYGHVFYLLGEHDQALSAFRTCQKISKSHIPTLYLAIQNSHMHQNILAEKYFKFVLEKEKNDPLVYHEFMILNYREKKYEDAVQKGLKCLELLDNNGWEATYFNLGHSFRKLNKLEEALSHYQKAREIDRNNPSTIISLAYTNALLGNYNISIELFHQALWLKSEDSFATEMLNRTLKLRSNELF